MEFTEHNLTAMLAELAAVRELILVTKLATSHKLEQIRRLRVHEKVTAWKRGDGFDRNEIIAERHRRTLRRLYLGDDPEHFQIGVHHDPRRPPTPQEFNEGIKAEVNRLK